MPTSTRRHFAKQAAIASAIAAAPAVRKGSAQGSPNDTVNVAVVGIAARGQAHYSAYSKMPNVRVTHLCDIDERLFDERVTAVEQMQGYRPKTETDFRKLIENKEIDAVSIATPDHWHGLQTVWACQAGKDVYVEKPVCFTIDEGRKMVQAARKYDRMVQCGLQRRSEARNHSVVKFLNDGSFGKPYRARVVLHRGRASIGKVQEASIPEGVNWNRYLGPAPYRAFDLNRFHYGWHFFWDTSTTEIGNNGVHYLDVVRWGLQKHVHPVKISCTGGKFADEGSDQEVPNVMQAQFVYDDGALVDVDMTTLYSPPFGGLNMGSYFFTKQGYVGDYNPRLTPEQRAEMDAATAAATAPGATAEQRANWRRLAAMDPGWKATRGEFTPGDRPDSQSGVSNRARNQSFPRQNYTDGPAIPQVTDLGASHFENFIAAVRSRKRENLSCEIQEGHMSTALCHLAVIAYKTGRTLRFDPERETFPGDPEANALLKRTYREPYSMPDEV